MEKVRTIPGVQLKTSLHPQWAVAIGNIAINGVEPMLLDHFLLDKFKVHTVAINWENIVGVRVTPNLYTTTKNLDVLVQGIIEFTKMPK
jgi:selenocysteine lyase/cysteine desulfurase